MITKKKITRKTIFNFANDKGDPRLSTIVYVLTQKEKDIVIPIVERAKKREK